jgi:hypothetical protein
LIFMIVFEFMIVSKLIVKIKFFGKTAKKSIRTHQRENHFTFTMIVIGIIFILFRLPVGVCYIIKSMYTGITKETAASKTNYRQRAKTDHKSAQQKDTRHCYRAGHAKRME